VEDGFVASLNRPGGNVTGMTTFGTELAGKRLDLLLKVVPQARKVGFLSGDKSYITYEQQTTSMLAAGRALGVQIMIVECHDDRDFESALAKMVEGGAGGMILGRFVFRNQLKVVSRALPQSGGHTPGALHSDAQAGSPRTGRGIPEPTESLGSIQQGKAVTGAGPTRLRVSIWVSRQGTNEPI
jgi:putative ABC transport system substrate-binding protein